MSCSSAVCRATRLCEPKQSQIRLRVNKKCTDLKWQHYSHARLLIYTVYAYATVDMLLAFWYPGWDWWWWWWWGANLKAIRPPFELHYHRWLIIALGCGATTEAASALLYGAVWYDLHVRWCEFFGLFTASLLCRSGQSEPRLWDRTVNNMGRENVMLITRKERTAREKNPVSFMKIFTLLPLFIHSYLLLEWI